MLESWLWILMLGFFFGQLARRCHVPALVGMVIAGIMLGPQVSGALDPAVLSSAGALRTLAVMIILMRAGLGLDREKLAQQGTVALRLGFLPACGEVIAVTAAAIALLDFDLMTGLLLGGVLGAESPAVIVPGMLRLKSLGWGVAKGIPDAILSGSALSDVLMLLLFSLVMSGLSQSGSVVFSLPGGMTLNSVQLLPFQLILQIGLGIGIGWGAAQGLVWLLVRGNWTQSGVQEVLVAAGVALGLVILAERVPLFSGYLAVMSMGFFLIPLDTPLARRLRLGFNGLWAVAEIILFVLMGATLQLQVLENTFWAGLTILVIGTLVGRTIGWFLSTYGSNWTWRERLFLLPGNSAKATVQAAIGGLPLAAEIEGGETILAISALSILVTAPLGAWGISVCAPQLLEKGEIDPTQVTIARPLVLMAAVDTSPLATQVLSAVADLARRSDGEVIVVHVKQTEDPIKIHTLQLSTAKALADIRHRFLTLSGPVPESILQAAQTHRVDQIVLGKRGHRAALVGSVSRSVLESSGIPVVIVEGTPNSSQIPLR